MSRFSFKSRVSRRSVSRPRLIDRLYRLTFEPLEDRTMMDSGVGSSGPASIVVGRTLSTPSLTPSPSYFVGEVQNNQVTVTYTVYNEQADPETGVLLTTTLEPGVTVANVSPQPDVSGQNLAWSLGTIQGYDRASVTLTVNLAGSSTTQLDAGAHVFATLDAGAVSNTTPAATLRTGNVSDPSLLASTPDANTTDPFVQEEAAKLSYDPQAIFNYLHTQVGYNSYTGSVRGARGTLWSSAGNALDVASLGVALMRASGVPAQYVQGTLSQSQAQSLILSMFPASYQTVGYIPAGTQTADPANDPQLLAETESHYWFQFNAGVSFKDADPLLTGGAVGQTFTAPSGTFAEVPNSLREKTEVKLVAEQASAGLFGLGGGLSTATVLDFTFNDVDLVGRPLNLGQFVNSTASGFIFSATVNTYTPFLVMTDEAFPQDPGQVMDGTPYQEVLTNFPLGSQVLTGVFLNVTLSGPQGPPETSERTLLDRIGFAARQNGAASNITASPGGLPAFNDFDRFTIDVMPSLQAPGPLILLQEVVQKAQASVQGQTDPNAQSHFLQSQLANINQTVAGTFMATSDRMSGQNAISTLVDAYYSRPRIIIVSSRVQPSADGTSAQLAFSIDLRRNSITVNPSPGQSAQAVIDYNAARGIQDSYLESAVFPVQAPTPDNPVGAAVLGTFTVFSAAADQGITIVKIGPDSLPTLAGLAISADAKARIQLAVQSGLIVYVPEQSVQLNGNPAVAWYESNPGTGELV
ncbi:MAG: transglutaminase domain-containing protein, partial [Isosphaeraceae bacterium]